MPLLESFIAFMSQHIFTHAAQTTLAASQTATAEASGTAVLGLNPFIYTTSLFSLTFACIWTDFNNNNRIEDNENIEEIENLENPQEQMIENFIVN